MAIRKIISRPRTMAAIALSLSLTGTAIAQDGTLAALIRSGNGQITSAQAESAARVQFQKLDTNHDGVLTEQEFVAERMKLFTAADSNADGVVNRAELRAMAISKLQAANGQTP